jgi:hypothetical protein
MAVENHDANLGLPKKRTDEITQRVDGKKTKPSKEKRIFSDAEPSSLKHPKPLSRHR